MEAVQPTAEPEARGPDEDTPAALRPLNPRVRLLWWVDGALTVAFLVVIVLVADLLLRPPLPRGLAPALVLAAGALLAGVLPLLRHRRWRYAVREQDLWIRQGVLWVTVSVIPFSRLQFVDTKQGPLERLFRLSSLVVHTAALGTSGRLPGLDVEEAERLRERLARVEVDAAGL